jgi:hypothetical protein
MLMLLDSTNTNDDEENDDMAKNEKTLDELFHDTLKDIYYAEKKILSSLPKMAKAAQSPKLKAAFEKHERETDGQIDRLEKVFEIIQAPARGKKCDAIEGILEEGEIMDEYGARSPSCGPAGGRAGCRALRDLALRHVERGRKLGLKQATALLDETLRRRRRRPTPISRDCGRGSQRAGRAA